MGSTPITERSSPTRTEIRTFEALPRCDGTSRQVARCLSIGERCDKDVRAEKNGRLENEISFEFTAIFAGCEGGRRGDLYTKAKEEKVVESDRKGWKEVSQRGVRRKRLMSAAIFGWDTHSEAAVCPSSRTATSISSLLQQQLERIVTIVCYDMLVDNPLQPSPFVVNPNDFSEFFNLDLLVGGSSSQQQGQGSSSSRASSNSPVPSFSALPSPPAPFLPTIVDSQATDFFNFYLDDEYTKVDPLAPPPPITGAPYDFFGAFSGLSSSGSQDESSPESGTTSTGQSPPLAIDPQLVGSPSKPMSDIDEEEEGEGGDEGDEDHDDLFAAIAPVKVGGKGKGRKGTVQSGGVQKKPIVSAVVKDSDNKDELDDWRPSPEEYKKMSSKEKRQLRNKISARNFRVRRKGESAHSSLLSNLCFLTAVAEYITTLEGDIAERDRLIDAIRTELGSTKSENSALRQEISALKKALLTGRAESPVLPPPGPIPPPVRASTTSSPLVTPNMHKDLPSSPRLASAKSFWGGSATFGGITPVHTTLIPESFAQPLANVKPVGSDRSIPASLQENINPSLNVNKVGLAAAAFGPVKGGKPGAFDAFAENNPFTMKMLDAYVDFLVLKVTTSF